MNRITNTIRTVSTHRLPLAAVLSASLLLVPFGATLTAQEAEAPAETGCACGHADEAPAKSADCAGCPGCADSGCADCAGCAEGGCESCPGCAASATDSDCGCGEGCASCADGDCGDCAGCAGDAGGCDDCAGAHGGHH